MIRWRTGATVALGVVVLFVLSLLRSEGPTRHDELLQRARRHLYRQQLLSAHHMGANEQYKPEQDCLHVKCKAGAELKHKWGADGEPLYGKPANIGDDWSKYGALGKGWKGVDNHVAPSIAPCLGKACKQLHGEKWGADGEPLDGHVRENIGDDWSEYGALGKGWKGVDNHVAPSMAPCLGKACKQLHGEKWGADGEPLDGHVRENIGDDWSEYGALGKGWKGVDNHVAPSMAPCLGKACKQLHGEKWGADGEPLDGHVRENIGDDWSEYGALGKGWPAVDRHTKSASPFACIGKACKLKKLSRADSHNVGDHYSKYGALGKPYKGTGQYVDRWHEAPPCLGGSASACHDASRPLGITRWGHHGKPIGRNLRPRVV